MEVQAAKISQPEPHWQQLNDLLGHMNGLPEAPAITAERDAIRDGRLLLDDPDKIAPLANRAAVNKNFGAYRTEYEGCIKELEAAPQWGKLAPEDRAAILRTVVIQKLANGPVQL